MAGIQGVVDLTAQKASFEPLAVVQTTLARNTTPYAAVDTSACSAH